MTSNDRSLASIRAEVCDSVYVWMLPITVVAGALSLSRYFEQGWIPVLTLHSVLLTLQLIITILRKRVPYTLRAGCLVALMFLIGIGGHLSFGSPYALVFFISASIMAAVLFSERIGIVISLLAMTTISAIYVLFVSETLPPPQPPRDPLLLTTWLTNTISALMASIGPLISVSRFRAYLDVERQRAEAASRAKSDFLATMSHELRTPMTAVLGITDLLLGERLSPSQTAKVNRIARSGRLLLDLLNDLLDFSKIESGHLVIHNAPFSLKELTDDVRDLMMPLASEKNLVLDITTAPDVIDGMVGDPTRLRQAMINLIGNAIKFTHSGHVAMRAMQSTASNGILMLHVSVTDTGIGIPSALQPKLFTPFVQADNGISRRFGGTGLGLAITRKLIELMNGEIAVSSIEGEGSTFSFSIPVSHDSTAKSLYSQSGNANDEIPDLKPLRVLVTDDNETTLYLMKEMLERWGHTVYLAENGLVAVEMVQKELPDIVLMDMQMPMLDGIGATRAIRKLSQAAAKIPILALTADAIATNHAAYLAAGINALVLKPVSWPELALAMGHWTSSDDCLADHTFIDTPQVSNDPILDESILSDLEQVIGSESLSNLLDKVHANITNCRGELVIAAQKKDTSAVRRLVHSLKGLTLQMGIVRAGKSAAAIEKADDSATLILLIAQLKSTLDQTLVAIECYVDKRAVKTGARRNNVEATDTAMNQ